MGSFSANQRTPWTDIGSQGLVSASGSGFVIRHRDKNQKPDALAMIRIRISKDLRDELKRRKLPGETYNNLLLRLLDKARALRDETKRAIKDARADRSGAIDG